MSLSYLSGDIDELVVVGKRNRPRQQQRQEKRQERKETRQEKQAERKETRQEKKEVRQENRSQKKEVRQEKKAEKKTTPTMKKFGIKTKKATGQKRTLKGKLKGKVLKKGGFVKKRVAKIGLAPARAAFLTVVSLNGGKVATKLVRVWRKEGGKQKITEFWTKFGGNIDKLKDAIKKGSKEQINGDSVGIALAAALATAAPIIVALLPIIKQFRAEGDAKEAAEFDNTLNDAKRDLSAGNVDGAEISEASMMANSDYGVVAKASNSDVEEFGSGGGGSGEGETMSSFASPLGAFFKFPLMISLMYPLFQNSPLLVLLLGIIQIYCFIGFVLFPFTELNLFGLKKYTEFYNYPCYTILNFKNYVSKRKRQVI